MYDLAIIGGGPAGVGAGVYASRKRLKTIFITRDWNSQSVVSEGIENWIGTVKISGPDFAKKMEEHLRAYANDVVDIKVGETVIKIAKKEEMSANKAISGDNPLVSVGFEITTDKSSYKARTILITAGSYRRKLSVPGADKYEHRGITYCASCDGPVFAGQDVVVIGGGNSAFESAAELSAYCNSVTLLNRSDEFKADPVTVKAVLSNPKVRALRNAQLTEIKGDKFVKSLSYLDKNSGEIKELPVTGIFAEIGSIPSTEFARDLLPLDPFGRIITDPRTQETSVSGIWAAGDCTDGLYHQNNISAGDAVKALEDIYMYLRAK
ncbi:MAG: FAD-dependent oxidoreductase [Patescibacteria group bacterium]